MGAFRIKRLVKLTQRRLRDFDKSNFIRKLTLITSQVKDKNELFFFCDALLMLEFGHLNSVECHFINVPDICLCFAKTVLHLVNFLSIIMY